VYLGECWWLRTLWTVGGASIFYSTAARIQLLHASYYIIVEYSAQIFHLGGRLCNHNNRNLERGCSQAPSWGISVVPKQGLAGKEFTFYKALDDSASQSCARQGTLPKPPPETALGEVFSYQVWITYCIWTADLLSRKTMARLGHQSTTKAAAARELRS
jgi:hypothetical protein